MAKRDLRFNSETMTQHVCLKGHNSSVVFCTDADRLLFLDSLRKACEEYDVDLLVYALMDNHVHLILHGDVRQFQFVFESVGANFARELNRRTGVNGAVWTERYFSGAIQSAEQFMRAASYVFRNPVRAGICKNPQDYEWSNFQELMSGEGGEARKILDELVNVENLLDCTISANSVDMTNREAMELGLAARKRVQDYELLSILFDYVDPRNKKKFDRLEEDVQVKIIKEMWDFGGSMRQIARVLNVKPYPVKKVIERF